MNVESQSSGAAIKRGLIIAALLIVASVVLQLLSPSYMSREIELRIFGVLTGGVVLIYANLVPKTITRRIGACGDPMVEQSIRRFTGWSLVLGGVAYAIVWMIAPLQYATALAVGVLGLSVLLVATRIAMVAARGSRT
jgi:hypothetical protein